MPQFSEASRNKLLTCDQRLVRVCEAVIKVYDFTVLEGHRSVDRQDELFRTGKSKKRGGESKHNRDPSLAVDLVPYPIDWDDSKRFFLLAGMMFQAAAAEGVSIRWGGDWDRDWQHHDQTFHDLPHFELSG